MSLPRPEEPPADDRSAEPSTDLESWQRLDARMLVVQPIREVIRFVPALIAVVVASSTAGGGFPWELIGLGAVVALGVVRYLTTSFRVAGGRVEVRRGLFNRQLLSTPVDRVRTIDLEAPLLHQLLGLQILDIGTGRVASDDDRLRLDGLANARAHRVRATLLAQAALTRPVGDQSPGQPDPTTVATGGAAGASVAAAVTVFDPRWARFVPLTLTGVAIGGAAIGVLVQALNAFGVFEDPTRLPIDDLRGAHWSWWLLVPAGLLGVLVAVSVLAIAGYLATNWGYRLWHDRVGETGTWRVRRGLFTSRETSTDDRRLRGVTLSRPLGLRVGGGAGLSAVVAGIGEDREQSAVLVPPAPLRTVVAAAAAVLGDPEPFPADLLGHGPIARRRRYLRAQWLPVGLSIAALLAVLVASWPPWLLAVALAGHVVGLVLGWDRARMLGHLLTPTGRVVSRSGSLLVREHVLESDSIIGWHQRSTYFQRRVGLCTLVLTTAGGRQAYEVPDVPEQEATGLSLAAAPATLGPFAE